MKVDKLEFIKWLMTFDKTQLSEEIFSIISKDDNLSQLWDIKYNVSQNGSSIKETKAILTKALPYRAIFEYRKVDAYFDKAENLFTSFYEILPLFSVEEQFMLLEHALKRLNKALEKIDDSYGSRFGVEGSLNEKFVDVFHLLPWAITKKVAYLSKHKAHSLDIYPQIPEAFFGNLELKSAYLQELAKQAELLPPYSINKEEHGCFRTYYHILNPLIKDAQNENNLDKLIKYKAIWAHDLKDYYQLCLLALRNNNLTLALNWEIKVYDLSTTLRDELTCLKVAVQIALFKEQHDKSLDLQWEYFIKSNSFDALQEFITLQNRFNIKDVNAINKGIDHLIEQIKNKQTRSYYQLYPELELFDLYIHYKKLDKAIELLNKEHIGMERSFALANELFVSSPLDAIKIYKNNIDNEISLAKNSSYRIALAWLVELQNGLNGYEIEFNDLINELRTKHKRKTNFMAKLAKKFT